MSYENILYQCVNCRGLGRSHHLLHPKFTSTAPQFWAKICFKFQSLCKISNVPDTGVFRMCERS